jgi:hypothetical protein
MTKDIELQITFKKNNQLRNHVEVINVACNCRYVMSLDHTRQLFKSVLQSRAHVMTLLVIVKLGVSSQNVTEHRNLKNSSTKKSISQKSLQK